MTLLLACGGGSGGGYSIQSVVLTSDNAEVDEGNAKVSSAPETSSNTERYTTEKVPENEELKKPVAETKLPEVEKSVIKTPEPVVKTWYDSDLEQLRGELQKYINAGKFNGTYTEGQFKDEYHNQAKIYNEYKDEIIRVRVLLFRIAKTERVKELFGELQKLNGNSYEDRELQRQIRQQINKIRYHSSDFAYQAFGDWLGEPEQKEVRNLVVNVYTGDPTKTSIPLTTSPSYTGKYVGNMPSEDLTLQGDVTAQVNNTFDGIDFSFKNLLGQHPHNPNVRTPGDDILHPNAPTIREANGVDLNIKATIKDNSINGDKRVSLYSTEINPLLVGEIDEANTSFYRNLFPDATDEQLERFREQAFYPKHFELEALFRGENHDGIIGKINDGDNAQRNLIEVYFEATKDPIE